MGMNYEALIPQNISEYLNRFTRTDYSAAYKCFVEGLNGFLPELYRCRELTAAAHEAVSYIDGRIKGLWKKRKLCDIRFFLIIYVSPALLGEENSTGRAFAEELRRAWLEKYPEQSYELGSYDQLSKGFNDTILGFKFNIGGGK